MVVPESCVVYGLVVAGVQDAQALLLFVAEPVDDFLVGAKVVGESWECCQGFFGGGDFGEMAFLIDGLVVGQTGPADHCRQQRTLDKESYDDDT